MDAAPVLATTVSMANQSCQNATLRSWQSAMTCAPVRPYRSACSARSAIAASMAASSGAGWPIVRSSSAWYRSSMRSRLAIAPANPARGVPLVAAILAQSLRRLTELGQVGAMRGQEVVHQAAGDRRVGHGAVGQHGLDEQAAVAAQCGFDGEIDHAQAPAE